MQNKIHFWLRLCLVNLFLVAVLGFLLRSKILFSLPGIDYRNLLSAHSHFAFSGWVGLALMALLTFELLPPAIANQKRFTVILIVAEASAVGMAFSFPFGGYTALSIIFSSLYILVSFYFAFAFIRQLSMQHPTVRMLAIAACISLVVSAVGPLGLSWMMATHLGSSLFYRDCIYTFLHFQYNGFFTLGVLALLFQFLVKKNIGISRRMHRLALFLVLSVIPSLFLSLLWHNNPFFLVLAVLGAMLLLAALGLLLENWFAGFRAAFNRRIASSYLFISLLSLAVKLLLTVGVLIPSLRDAIYGNRPVIIGFLHLVFLGFVSFFILAYSLETGLFSRRKPVGTYASILFGTGIFLTELLLALQGLGVLFLTNSFLYNWLLWGAAMLLVLGSALMMLFSWNRKVQPQP